MPEFVLLEDARQWVRQHAGTGVSCPCCGQFAKIYRRQITSTMARWLIALVRHHQQEPRSYSVREPWSLAINGGTGDVAKLVHWGLVVAEQNDDEAKRTSGLWQPTRDGYLFAYNKICVPKYVYIYDARVLRRDGPCVWVQDALGRRFDYKELMS